jgi:hypothetical protein
MKCREWGQVQERPRNQKVPRPGADCTECPTGEATGLTKGQ